MFLSGPALLRQSTRVLRRYSTTVQLSFDKHASKSTTTQPPIVICHGLFGSKQNWKSLAKALSSRLSRDVYAVDLRNHGDSAHNDIHTYDAMAGDLLDFLSEHHLDSPVLLGHSMGGKAVMAAALREPSHISKLVVVDMPPVSLGLSSNFSTYIAAMKEIEDFKPRKQSEADKILAKYEPDVGVRSFLLTNLKRTEDGELKFRVPYNILGNALNAVGSFDVGLSTYEKPTLFIAGGKSPYYPPFLKHADAIREVFPTSRLEVVQGAGHWGKPVVSRKLDVTYGHWTVHAEQPQQVLQLIAGFVDEP